MQPRLGILSVLQAEERADCPFGEQTALFAALHQAALASGMRAYVICPQSLQPGQPQLKAYALQQGKWVEAAVAPPHVVYNRLPSRQVEQAPDVQRFASALHKWTGGRVFNRSGFFSKLQVHTILQKQMPAGLQLPATDTAAEAEQVLRQAAVWGELWLKPDDGSLGRGVYRIIREPFGFAVESSDAAAAENMETAEAVSHLRTLLPQRAYLIQQGISRAEQGQRPFDLRVLLHKNGQGRFAVTHQFARWADYGQIVTNVMAGGEGHSLKEWLTKAEQKKLQMLSLAVAKRLASAMPGPLGELGLDLALDKQRQFWLIEANSKPRLKMDPADPQSAVIAGKLVAYAHYLLQASPPPPTPRTTLPPAPSSLPRVPRAPKDR